MRRSSIKTRLVAMSLAATAAALVVASVVILGHQRQSARQDLLDHLESTAAVIGANCTAALAFGDVAAAREALEAAAHVPSTLQAVLYRADASVLAAYRRPGPRGAIPPPRQPERGRWLSGDTAQVVAPVVLDGRAIGTIYLRASTTSIDRDALRHAGVAAGVLACTLLAALVLLERLISRATRPIVALSTLTQTVSAGGDCGLRAVVRGDDEVATLAAGLNQMLATLQQRDAELEAHRRRLEAEVSERTRALAASNARLQVELQVRRRAEAALLDAAHHWRATFDGIRDGMCVLDGRGHVLHANLAMHELLVAASGTLDGSPMRELLRRLLQEAEAQDVAAGEGRTLRRGGNRWFELQRDRIELPGNPGAGFVQVVADVTRQHRLQEQLGQSQKMQAVGQLAGGVAHDFNNLLSVILTFSSSLCEELPDGELRQYAHEIERAGQRAAALTRQLLAFSRKQVLHPRTLDAGVVVADVAGMIERLIGERIRLVLRVEGCSGCVHMDPSQLEQVLVNLAVNARDAMPDGGEITIAMMDVELAPSDAPGQARVGPGQYVRITVSDTGTGIAPDVLPHVFEPFFTTKEKGKGTGLGLAMVYGAVQQSGGSIEVASAPASGATFTIHLPRVAAEPAAARPEPEPVPLGHGERVLVVEDESQLRAMVRRVLTDGGYEVLEAAHGEEGLKVFREHGDGIDLVLTDLVMPGVGGLALGRALRERSAVPILFMSGYSEEMASGKERLPEGQFLQKPFDRPTLLRRIRAALAVSAAPPR
ncbi:MAG TPA: ATP-binding protein [Anaeromyxobacteraceae bacterium]